MVSSHVNETFLTLNTKAGEGLVSAERKRLNKSLQRIKFKNVCKSCNNGWMSVIVNDAKPIVVQLVENSVRAEISPAQQTKIALWICVTAIMAEFLNPKKGFSSEFSRDFIFKHRKPPPNWQIWIGCAADDLAARGIQYSHQRTLYAPPSTAPQLHDGVVEQIDNCCEISTNCIKGLVYHAVRNDNMEHLAAYLPPIEKLYCIWPKASINLTLDMSTLQKISVNDFSKLTYSLVRCFSNDGPLRNPSGV